MGRKLHADTENQTDRQNYQLLHRQYRPPLNISNPLRVEKKNCKAIKSVPLGWNGPRLCPPQKLNGKVRL